MKFIGTKIITAEAMNRAAYNDYRGGELPANEAGGDAGYLVEYTDGGKPNDPRHAGYISWSPKEQFDNAYRPCDAMTFGLAIEAMKRGQSVSRAGWNGKGMFAYLVPANAYPAQTGVAKAFFGEGALVPYNAYMALKGVDGTVSTWVPSVNDTLAEDWQIVDVSALVHDSDCSLRDEPAMPAGPCDCSVSAAIPPQPPVDNAHVAPGCEQFSDPLADDSVDYDKP